MNDLLTDIMVRLSAKAGEYTARQIYDHDDDYDDEEPYPESPEVGLRHYRIVNAGVVQQDGTLDASQTVKFYEFKYDDEEDYIVRRRGTGLLEQTEPQRCMTSM